MRVLPVTHHAPVRGARAWLASRSNGRRLHAGVDLSAPAGTPVLAPEAGRVVRTWRASYGGDVPRWSQPAGFAGYGPAGLLLLGESGRWHLLGHVAPVVAEGAEVDAGVRVATILDRSTQGSPVRHLHWEVRELAAPPPGAATVEIVLDPLAWLDGRDRRYLDLDPRVCPRVRWRAGEALALRRLCPRACRLPSSFSSPHGVTGDGR